MPLKEFFMKHNPNKSSKFESFKYANGTLEVKFLDGSVVLYYDVPDIVAIGLKYANSPMNYLRSHVIRPMEEKMEAEVAKKKAEQVEIDEFRVKYGGDLKKVDVNGQTLLHKAVCEKRIALVKFLTVNGVDVDAKDRNGYTALDIALRGEWDWSREAISFLSLYKTKPWQTKTYYDSGSGRKSMLLSEDIEDYDEGIAWDQ